MKMRQVWGWLMAGVAAAGLNAGYHDGCFQWVHVAADRIVHSSAAVIDLASGRADQFLTEVQLVAARSETSCPFSKARPHARIARAEADPEQFDAAWDRQEIRMARIEAMRARIEARVAAQTARLRVAAIDPEVLRAARFHIPCPRVRVNVQQPHMSQIPAPATHIETPGAGPV